MYHIVYSIDCWDDEILAIKKSIGSQFHSISHLRCCSRAELLGLSKLPSGTREAQSAAATLEGMTAVH